MSGNYFEKHLIVILKQTLLLVLFSVSSNAQSAKDPINQLQLSSGSFRDEPVVSLVCNSNCLTINKAEGYLSFVLRGKSGEKDVVVKAETPVLKGTKKIRLDKDGDASLHQELTIEISGSNPAVDKDVYEIQTENDEAVITILKYDEVSNEAEGTFSVKYFDSATGVKKLSATCRFRIP